MIFNKIEKTSDATKINMSFKTLSENGLLIYNGRPGKDFISVGLQNSFLTFQYNLGSGKASIKSKTKISLNQWITVEAKRSGARGYIKIGDEETYVKSSGRFTKLNLEGELFVGGHIDVNTVAKQTLHEESFTGCIGQLIINDEYLDLGEECRYK